MHTFRCRIGLTDVKNLLSAVTKSFQYPICYSKETVSVQRITAFGIQIMKGQVNIMKSKKRTAALLAAVIAVTPLSVNSSLWCSHPAIFTMEAAAATRLPDWIPNDLQAAVSFRTEYGATHIEDGLICVVSRLEQEKVPEGEPQGVLRYDIQSTDPTVKTVRHTHFAATQTNDYYDIAVFQPQQDSAFEIAVIDTWAKETDADLQYGHAINRYAFSVKGDSDITETDIYGWLPDCTTEYSAYSREHGTVSVHGNYIVFCLTSIVQFSDRWEPDPANQYENAIPAASSTCTMESDQIYDDGSIDMVYAYQAVKDGYEKISWVRESGTRMGQPEEAPTVLTANSVILDNAQTILLEDQTRVTVTDSAAGGLVPDAVLASEPFTFYADIVKNDDLFSGLNTKYTVSKNRSILEEPYLCPSLSSLAMAYKKADHFAFNSDITPEITYYDNGAMDLMFRTKRKITGDVNGDGRFTVSDVVLLEKWLRALPDAELANWEEADFCTDHRLNAADLSMMKRALLSLKTDYTEPDFRVKYGSPFFIIRSSLENGLTLYSGPGENYEAITVIPAGTRLIEAGYNKDENDWLFTQYNGRYGWIKTVDGDGNTVIFFEVQPDKPVIYLYPEQETDVHIELELTESELYTTYPKYQNGWDVTAYPDGTLLNKADGSHHRYLFWDSVNCRTRFDFSRGFCIAGSDTEQFLKETLPVMGLNEQEMNEFIVYWLPRMEHNTYNLIAFQNEAYTETAKLTVSPAPDSECRIFMAYVPLEAAVAVEPQQITPFERHGFAVVEWGGVEIRAKNG